MTQALVMLPGMMCDARLFAYQADRLGQDMNVVIPAPSTSETMSEMASQVLASAPEQFALCGLSMGGILAMEMMHQAPQRITRLALMDTNPLAETNEGAKRRDRQIEDVKQGKLRQVVAEEMKPLYLADGPNRTPILDLCMEMCVSCGDNIFIAQSLALRDRPDQTKTLQTVTCPTLILHGAEDRLCPPERHQLLQQLMPHADLVQVEHAGHLPPLEQPEKTLAHLQDWLQAQ